VLLVPDFFQEEFGLFIDLSKNTMTFPKINAWKGRIRGKRNMKRC
jgi:hypothetical protein